MADGCAPKRVFLRKVLYRIDFQFITEQKQEEKLISFLHECLIEKRDKRERFPFPLNFPKGQCT